VDYLRQAIKLLKDSKDGEVYGEKDKWNLAHILLFQDNDGKFCDQGNIVVNNSVAMRSKVRKGMEN